MADRTGQERTGIAFFIGRLFSSAADYVLYGTGAVILALIAYYLGKTPPASIWLLVIAFGFISAAYKAWRDERLEANKNILALIAARESKPQFLSSLAASLGSIGDRTQVLTDLTVYNQGNKSSILKNWDFTYSNLVGGKTHHILHMPLNIAITPTGIEQMGDPISTDSGVPPGGQRTYRRSYPLGWSLEQINGEGLKITITFRDIDDRPYSASAEFPAMRIQKIS